MYIDQRNRYAPEDSLLKKQDEKIKKIVQLFDDKKESILKFEKEGVM